MKIYFMIFLALIILAGISFAQDKDVLVAGPGPAAPQNPDQQNQPQSAESGQLTQHEDGTYREDSRQQA